MTSQGSPLSRFRRAVAGTSAGTPFGRYAVRWASRYFDSTDRLELADAHALVAALNGLPESRSSLEALLRARGQRELAGVASRRGDAP